jgi:adenosylhomocysteine nucleosidase
MESRPGVLILTAIAMEHGHVVQGCLPGYYGALKREPVGPIGKWDVSVKMIGIRAAGLNSIEIPPNTKLIIMAGLAGGLDPSLSIGDVIVAGAPDWVRIPERIKRREVVTTDRAVTSIAAKAEVYAKTHAAAVDMETSIVRDWAKSKEIDFVAIRAISDTASDAIDPRVMTLVDAYGNPRPTHVGSYLLGNPLRLRQLMKLGTNSKRAAENLGKAVREVIGQLPDQKN